MKLIRSNKGFNLAELLIAMAIFGILMSVAGGAFNLMMTESAKQTRMAESNIEGTIGLEIMRGQLNSAGFGLPWSFANSISYDECDELPGSAYNEASGAPAALRSGNGDANTVNGSDVLIVRSQSIGDDPACKRWSYVNSNGVPKVWASAADRLQDADVVVAVKPGFDSKIGVATNELVMKGSAFSATFANYSVGGLKPPPIRPGDPVTTHLLYGVSGSGSLRMPFNRADYFVRLPADDEGANRLPARCNPDTGVLVKATVGQGDGTYTKLPLLDCVADLQVVFGLKDLVSGRISYTDNASSLTPKQIREQVREIRVYVLTHDGGKDNNFSYPQATISVGSDDTGGLGRTFDLADLADYRKYRWKVYKMVVKPKNLSSVQQN